jgi:hypothetical protein
VLAATALVMRLGAVSLCLGLQRAAATLRIGASPAILLLRIPALLPATLGFRVRGLFVAASFPLNAALVARLGAAALGLRAGDRGRGGRLRAVEPGDPRPRQESVAPSLVEAPLNRAGGGRSVSSQSPEQIAVRRPIWAI